MAFYLDVSKKNSLQSFAGVHAKDAKIFRVENTIYRCVSEIIIGSSVPIEVVSFIGTAC
ncbi:hypothetical protein ACJJIR_12195 [Microbulbifer sp. SSSA008]|uniref:hypothetical protein n=1 Tax=Microbulbifer sp. SSSA008 TaxID=3243380 RepID=UPI00403947D8